MKWTLTIGLLLVASRAFAAPTAAVEIDGMLSTPPADWEEAPAGGMRLKQWVLKPAKADEQVKTELVIFFFGPGGGGNAADNVTRWKGMFENPTATQSEEKIAGAKTTIVEITGTYLYKARPMDSASPPEKRPGQRMIGVVWETQGGPYFMRLVGPDATVAHHKPEFLGWLRAFRKK